MTDNHLAVGAIVRRGPDILLISQDSGEEPEPVWALPGGQVQQGETIPAALRRTVATDTGLSTVLAGALIWVAQYEIGGASFASYGFEMLGGHVFPEEPLATGALWVRADEAITRLARMWFAPIREPALGYLTGRAVPATLWTWTALDGRPETVPTLFADRSVPDAVIPGEVIPDDPGAAG